MNPRERLIHTDGADGVCRACLELDRRAHTHLGRFGSWLIRVGLWLGGRP